MYSIYTVKMLLLESVLVLAASLCFTQAKPTATPAIGSKYLYIPEGKTREQGVVIEEVGHDQLPPGQYEIVAMFSEDGVQPLEQQQQQQSHFTYSPTQSPRPPSPLQYSTPRPLQHQPHLTAGPQGAYPVPQAASQPAHSYAHMPNLNSIKSFLEEQERQKAYMHRPPAEQAAVAPAGVVPKDYPNFPAKREIEPVVTNKDRVSPYHLVPGQQEQSQQHYVHPQQQQYPPQQQHRPPQQLQQAYSYSVAHRAYNTQAPPTEHPPQPYGSPNELQGPAFKAQPAVPYYHQQSHNPNAVPPHPQALIPSPAPQASRSSYEAHFLGPSPYGNPPTPTPAPVTYPPATTPVPQYDPSIPMYPTPNMVYPPSKLAELSPSSDVKKPIGYGLHEFHQHQQQQQQKYPNFPARTPEPAQVAPQSQYEAHYRTYTEDRAPPKRHIPLNAYPTNRREQDTSGYNAILVTPVPKMGSQAVIPGAQVKAYDPRKTTKDNGLKKLYDIAKPSTSSRTTLAGTVSTNFACPFDGHFPDAENCSKFYRCAHGTALVEFCPGNLFWNAKTDQCDWPSTVDCSMNSKSMNRYKLPKDGPATTLFLTFDDGPNEGTEAVLKVLRRENVRATFFINSKNLHDPDPQVVARNVNNLLTMIKDGHVVADHSYDHMYHNSQNSPRNAYQSKEDDMKYFGLMNAYPVLDLLWRADLKDYISYVNHTLSTIVRMPYSNNWRVAPKVHRDCFGCTIPASSGQLAIEMADQLEKDGKIVLGWDIEWEMDWDVDRLQYGGKELFFNLSGKRTRHGTKMVLLSHDRAFRPRDTLDSAYHGGADTELETFLRMAKAAGYKFETADYYPYTQ